MQTANLKLKKKRIWGLPIIDYYLKKTGFSDMLSEINQIFSMLRTASFAQKTICIKSTVIRGVL